MYYYEIFCLTCGNASNNLQCPWVCVYFGEFSPYAFLFLLLSLFAGLRIHHHQLTSNPSARHALTVL
ncbi:hypothetical protein AB3S75_031216 [Citrus x aurantiifolia]